MKQETIEEANRLTKEIEQIESNLKKINWYLNVSDRKLNAYWKSYCEDSFEIPEELEKNICQIVYNHQFIELHKLIKLLNEL